MPRSSCRPEGRVDRAAGGALVVIERSSGVRATSAPGQAVVEVRIVFVDCACLALVDVGEEGDV